MTLKQKQGQATRARRQDIHPGYPTREGCLVGRRARRAIANPFLFARQESQVASKQAPRPVTGRFRSNRTRQ